MTSGDETTVATTGDVPPDTSNEGLLPDQALGADLEPSMGRLSFAVEPMIDENLTSVTLVGEIDSHAQDKLDLVLTAAIEAESKMLLVDASQADFVSTAAMLSIVSAARHVGRVLIYRPNCATQRIFSLIDPEGLCQSIS